MPVHAEAQPDAHRAEQECRQAARGRSPSTAGRYIHCCAWPPTRTALAAQLAEDAAERFLRYVRIDTQSDEDSESYPSTAKQLDLLRLLADELKELGLDDAAIDEHGYVTATLPATVAHETQTIAFFAHVDTAREVSGANVNPQRFRYEGGDIPLGRPAR